MKSNKTNRLLLVVAVIFLLGAALGYSTGHKENLDIIQQCEALLPRYVDCVLAAVPIPEEPL